MSSSNLARYGSGGWLFPSRGTLFPTIDTFFLDDNFGFPVARQRDGSLTRIQDEVFGPPLKTHQSHVTNNDQKFEVAVDVAGMKEEDINIEFKDNVLKIRGERKASGDNYDFSSRFSQSYTIGEDVEMDKFDATLENGVLKVFAPKKELKKLEEPSVRKIPIKTNGNGNKQIEAEK